MLNFNKELPKLKGLATTMKYLRYPLREGLRVKEVVLLFGAFDFLTFRIEKEWRQSDK